METHETIRLLREAHDLSQEALAEMTGYKDRSSIAKIESGSIDLSQSRIAAFAKALGVSPAQLIGVDDATSANTFSSILKHQRKALGLTRAQIAKSMGVSETTVHRWENGNIKTLGYKEINRLSNLLGVSPSVLMGWDSSKSSRPAANPSLVMPRHLIEKIPFISVIKKYCLGHGKPFSDVVTFYEAPENNAELESLLFYGVPKLNDKTRIESIIGCKIEKAVHLMRPELETALPLVITRSDVSFLARLHQLNGKGLHQLEKKMAELTSSKEYLLDSCQPTLIAARGDGSALEGITSIDGDLSDHEDDLIP